MKLKNSIRAGLFLTAAMMAGPLAALELKETASAEVCL